MAIRKTKQESFLVEGTTQAWLSRAEQALHSGGFTNVKLNTALAQLTGDYKKATVWGRIAVTLLPEAEKVQLAVEATANADNVIALFSSPTQKILDQFKNNL